MAYTVINTDLMSGTKQPADLVSVRVYDTDGTTPIECENGAIVELVALEDGEREVYVGKLATAASDLADCVVIDGPEVFYDERKKNLEEWINEAGRPVRGYRLNQHDIFGITVDGFVGATAPDKGDSVALGAGGKIEEGGSGTALGIIADVTEYKFRTFYAVQVGKINA